jgi:DnaJ-class molecular chaperone
VPPPRPFYRDFGDAAGREKYRADAGIDPEDLEGIFAQAFGGRAGTAGGRRFSMRGRDAQYQLTLDFLDAVNGATRRITLPDGRTLDVRIPAGVRDGQVIRLRGQGMPGIGDGAPGDALVEVVVAPHPRFRREGDDIIVELPVTLQEAVLGATLEVPTIKGPVRLTIPPNSGRGTRLRLRGRGIEGKGHQFVELHPVLPPADEPELAEFLRTWKPRHPVNPRAGTADQ